MWASLDKTKTSRGFPSSSLELSEDLLSLSLQDSAPEAAKCLYEENLSRCRFAAQENVVDIPRFLKKEVAEGLILGTGGFASVYGAKGFFLVVEEGQKVTADEFDEAVDDGEIESRHFIARHCHRVNGDARYAIKRLNRKTIQDTHLFLHGMTDLANETLFLSSLQHPNIIKLRGISMEEMFSADYFLILDRLYDTLAVRLVKWKTEKRKHRGLVRILRRRDKSKRKKLLATRLTFASHLASAVAYLHANRVLHRDLKPTNIGFDVRGDIKIFDFGLAKEIPSIRKGGDGTFKLTTMAGTPRYMAPEVALGKKYDESSDIYSLGLLVWEFLTLQRPYINQENIEDFQKNVWSGKELRPNLPKKLSSNLKNLLQTSWDQDLSVRPTAKSFENTLRFEASVVREVDGALNEEEEYAGEQTRRSTFLLIPGQGEAVNRSSPTVMALAEICESDSAIFHSIGASRNSVFTSSMTIPTEETEKNIFDDSIRSESAIKLSHENLLSDLAATRDFQMSLSLRSEGLPTFPPPLTNLRREESGQSCESIDSLDL